MILMPLDLFYFINVLANEWFHLFHVAGLSKASLIPALGFRVLGSLSNLDSPGYHNCDFILWNSYLTKFDQLCFPTGICRNRRPHTLSGMCRHNVLGLPGDTYARIHSPLSSMYSYKRRRITCTPQSAGVHRQL
jgi:hypothetical protein